MCDAVLDTGATDSIVASSLASDPSRRGYCAVKVGDGHYTYSKGEKSVDVCMGNFNLPWFVSLWIIQVFRYAWA